MSLHHDEFDLDVVTGGPGVRANLMGLFNEFLCLCLIDARDFNVELNRKSKSWQRIRRPIRTVAGVFLRLTERDMTRYLDLAELFVLLVGHKTDRAGEACRIAGSK